MNLKHPLAASLLLAGLIGMSASLSAQTMPAQPKPAPAPAPAPAPGKPGEKPEKPAKIEGIELARKDGTFIGVTADGVRLVVKFYNAKKKPMLVNVARGNARWNPVNVVGEVRSVLNPDEQKTALTSTPVLRPPLVYKVYLTLIDTDENEVESFVVDMRLLAEANAKP